MANNGKDSQRQHNPQVRTDGVDCLIFLTAFLLMEKHGPKTRISYSWKTAYFVSCALRHETPSPPSTPPSMYLTVGGISSLLLSVRRSLS